MASSEKLQRPELPKVPPPEAPSPEVNYLRLPLLKSGDLRDFRRGALPPPLFPFPLPPFGTPSPDGGGGCLHRLFRVPEGK